MAIALAHRYSRFGGTLALLRMAFYAVLIPWHAVSQANAALSGADHAHGRAAMP
jgi:hypothetical protein